MEIIILILFWFAVGFVYFINLTASEAFDELTDMARGTLLFIFLPTTIFIYFLLGIEYVIKRLKRNGKM